MERVKVAAPAKLNLHLQVLGRRPDGFHELRTLLQSIDLADELEAESATEGVLHLHVEPRGAAPEGDENLVLRAARALWREAGARPGARLGLHKRIPAGAGLGGGSADAAAALVVLDSLWSLGLGVARLSELAASLGSDVPFFLHGGLALGVGRGEEVYPLPDMPELGVLVAWPDLHIPTAEVYRRLEPQLTWASPEATVYAFAVGHESRPRWEDMRNDLQPVVLRGWPAVAELLRDLHHRNPLRAAVTGSGSAVFALFERREQAEAAASGCSGRWCRHAGVTLSRAQAQLVRPS